MPHLDSLRATTAPAKVQESFLRRPRGLWWRGVLFQIHLWVGSAIALYICVIGISGSILVFENELTRLSRPSLFTPLFTVSADVASRVPLYLESARRAFGAFRSNTLYLPTNSQPTIQLDNGDIAIYEDPASARVLGTIDNHFWVNWVRELHVRLLSGETGGIVNGIGAGCSLLMCLTGMVIWWPGLKHWSRSIKVDFRRRWPRINFDLHSAIGFWTLFFVAVWAVSGIYFTWPVAFVSALNLITPTQSAARPLIHVPRRTQPPADVVPMIRKAQSLRPGSSLLAIEFPEQDSGVVAVVMSPGEDFDRATYFFFDGFSSQLLRTWERGPGSTAGTRIIYWLAPLHFGQNWGQMVKVIWSLLGLTLPALAVTGVLMYWNRFLRKKVRMIL